MVKDDQPLIPIPPSSPFFPVSGDERLKVHPHLPPGLPPPDGKSLYYLASPYSVPEGAKELHYEYNLKALKHLLSLGYAVLSPIAHTHPIGGELPRSWEDFWGPFSLICSAHCDACLVLQLPGYNVSRGVREEILFFQSLNRPVYWLCPNTVGLDLSEIEKRYAIFLDPAPVHKASTRRI